MQKRVSLSSNRESHAHAKLLDIGLLAIPYLVERLFASRKGKALAVFAVLKERSTYAGLEGSLLPQSEAEVAAETFAKRLVEYDRNSAVRTTVIDDQSDYYEIDGNCWLSTKVII